MLSTLLAVINISSVLAPLIDSENSCPHSATESKAIWIKPGRDPIRSSVNVRSAYVIPFSICNMQWVIDYIFQVTCSTLVLPVGGPEQKMLIRVVWRTLKNNRTDKLQQTITWCALVEYLEFFRFYKSVYCFLKTLGVTRNYSLTWQYGHKNVTFSRICRAIPQTFVAQKPLDYFAVQGKKETVGLLFLAGNVEVWLLKVAAAAVAVLVEASIPGWWMLFWVTATPCLPEASLSSVTRPSTPLLPAVHPHFENCPSRPCGLTSNSLYMSMCVCFQRREGGRVSAF